MTLIPLNIGKPYYNVDPVSKSILSDAITDGYIDETNTLRRRGGLKRFLDLADHGGEADRVGHGIWYYNAWDCLIVRHGSKAYHVHKDGSVHAFDGVTFALAPTSFAEGAEISGDPCFYLFDGGYPALGKGLDIEGPTWTLARLEAGSGSPSAVKWGAWLDGRFLIAGDGSRNFFATDTNPGTGNIEPDYFLAADNPLTAETKPDNITFLGADTQELFVWGPQGMEVWVSDSNFFSPVKGAFSEAGLIAPRSAVQADNAVFALCAVDGGNKRAVVKMNGRVPVVVSQAIEKILGGYGTVNDATAWITRDSEYVITFPSEGKTWCWDYRNDTWYEWTKWDAETAERQEFLGRYSASAWGKTYFLSRTDGKIYEYDRASFTDDGGTMAMEWRTGQIGRGVESRCHRLRLQLKRGAGPADGASLVVRWRDNGRQEWRVGRVVNLGNVGDSVFFKDVVGLGTYLSRQYSFTITDNADIAIANVWEDITTGAR